MRRWLFFLWLCLIPLTLHAAPDWDAFARIPLVQDGRVKPLESFARVMLKRLSGASSLPELSADAWMAELLFAPEKALYRPVFHIQRPAVLKMLGLPATDDGLYRFTDLARAFSARATYLAALAARDRKNLSPDEEEMLRLNVNLDDFAQAAGSFSLFDKVRVEDASLRTFLHLPDGPLDYLSLARERHHLSEALAAVVSQKGAALDRYSEQEKNLALLNYRLDTLEAQGKTNTLLRVMPPVWNAGDWLSPWQVVELGAGAPSTAERFRLWRVLRNAYYAGDASGISETATRIGALSEGAPGVRPAALATEVFYNRLSPLRPALLGYAAALAFGLFALWRRSARAGKIAYGLLALAASFHAAALLMRMFILQRPPVSTLYESMLFVSFTGALFGLISERARRGAEGVTLAASVAFLLLAVADTFAADSDTLEVLVAVLNTRFWLATHVICITTGYGASLVTGMTAHLYLLKRASGASEEALHPLFRRLHLLSLVALLFTATGTMLGGIWADQSWGRFWGWDPKENGALWIVLWLIWLLHGRIAGQLRPLAFAALMACITLVVALAWVGVNLLSVGLHSYGFTDAAADGLTGFCGAEILVIGGLLFFIRRRKRNSYGR